MTIHRESLDLMHSSDLVIAGLLALGAILYTSVGHAGSSIYIAIMSLFNLPAPVIKPTALSLNILVSSFTSWRYIKAKFFDLKLLIPLCIGAIPFAFLGGHLQLPVAVFKTLLGIILLFSGVSFLAKPNFGQERIIARPHISVSILIGAAIGFLSGLTGTGGGIFLSPLILLMGWASVRAVSGTASVFIFVNSVSGLLGNFSSVSKIPSALPLYAAAVLFGAIIGTRIGIRQFSNTAIKRALGGVLIIAGAKLIFHL